MTDIKTQFQTYLASEESEALSKAQKNRAIAEMVEAMKGKTHKQLSEIWKSELKEVTEKWYRNEKRFPDCNEALSRGDSTKPRWRLNTDNKRWWWIKRMQGKSTRNDKPFAETLVAQLRQLTKLRGMMTPTERRLVEKELRKAILRIKGSCLWCENRKALLPTGYCSKQCENQSLAYKSHEMKQEK